MYYYYDAQNNYVGCGNEATPPAGCTASETPPELTEPHVAVPQSVTMRQARLQLLVLGKLAEVETAIAAMGDSAKITWEFSSVVERNNPLVAPMQQLFGWTDEQVDEMFIAASQL